MKTFFKISSAIVLVAMLSVGCKKEKEVAVVEVDEPRPIADFTVEVPDTVIYNGFQFKSNSINYKEILWQFGDDSTSTDVAPYHKYIYDGDYHVVLTTRNSQGFSASREIILKVADPNLDKSKVGVNYFLTIGGILTVSRDNGGGPDAGEGSKKVVDGDPNTKFLQSGFAGDLVMTFELDSAVVAAAYTMISGNDSPDRDPKKWQLFGSEDGIKFIPLDSKSDITFERRNQRRIFHFQNYVAYKFYRIKIVLNNGSRDFQLSEWTVNNPKPE